MKLASCPISELGGHHAAWELLAEVYRRETGKALPPISIGAFGRPEFMDSPYYFSLTHTDKHAFCVLSEHKVGIDAEELDRPVKLSLAKKILSPGELAQFEQARDKRRALLTFWVLKESYFKMKGTGLQGFPNQTDFSLADARVREMDGCLVAVMEEEDDAL